MASNLKHHVEDDRMEQYSMHRLGEEESAELEEHLLLCESCRQRLEQTDALVSGIRAAATDLAKAEAEPHPARWWGWAAGAALAAAAILVIARVGPLTPAGAPVAVQLQVTRGSAPASAPPATELRIIPDLVGLAVFDSYPLEVVDAEGLVVWQGKTARTSPSAMVPGRKAGVYFVRVYSPSRELLREYALRIGR